MDSLIPSVNLPGLGRVSPEGSLVVQIENPPPELQKLRLGETLLLELVQNGGKFDPAKLQAMIKDSVTGKLLDIPAPELQKLGLGETLLLVTLQGGKNLNLPDGAEYKLSARLVSKNPQGFELKVLTINNQKPEDFLSRPTDGTTSGQTVKNLVMPEPDNGRVIPAKTETAIITDKNSLFSKAGMLPLKLGTALEKIFMQNNVPPAVARQLGESLNNFSLQLQIAAVPAEPLQNPAPASSPDPSDLLRNIVMLVKNNVPSEDGALPENVVQQLTKDIIGQVTAQQNKFITGEMKTADGRLWPIVESPLGPLVPETNLKIPNETKVLLQITGLFQNKAAETPKLPLSGLKEIFELLRARGMSELESTILEKIPQHNEKLLSNIMSFVKAARSGRPEHWLGAETLNRLKAAETDGAEVLEKLNNAVNAQVQENSGWKIINIPFYGDNMFNRIRIAVKKMEDEELQRQEKRRKEKSAVRFVVDTSFSVLGAFQLDGFSFVKDKRFDLIVRTEKDMTHDFCSEMMRLFQKSLGDVGYSGNMKINVKENFIKICEDENKNATLENGIFI
ncbi:MAG: hypothetical protein SO314_07605 [Alphaproteobacteria bacterium]|nr:hypothetical protein [Alphaproteobacteria bacterium]